MYITFLSGFSHVACLQSSSMLYMYQYLVPFFFFNIYLFLALWGLHCHTHGLFSSCGEQGLLSSCGALASVVVEHIDTWTSRVAAHGL